MVELTCHNVAWCPVHGGPVLALEIDDSEQYIAVTLSVADARALSPLPSVSGTDRARLCGVMLALLAGLGGRLREVRLDVGTDGLLRSCLVVDGPRGTFMLPAHTADWILLARQADLPLRMAAGDLTRAGYAATRRPEACGDQKDSRHLPTDMLAPFRQFIESLDLDDQPEHTDCPGDANEHC